MILNMANLVEANGKCMGEFARFLREVENPYTAELLAEIISEYHKNGKSRLRRWSACRSSA